MDAAHCAASIPHTQRAPNGLKSQNRAILRGVSPRGGWVGRRKDVKYLNETAARSLIPKAYTAQ